MNDADRCIIYAIITCVLIAIRFELPLIYNFAIGLSAGGVIINSIFVYARFKRTNNDG